MTAAQGAILALRVLMETGIVVALGWWGFATGDGALSQIALGVGAPVIAFGFWGAVDFRWAGRAAEPLRLTQELAISGLAAVAWYAAGQHALGIALATLSAAYHAVVYLSGERLLKPAS
ncbi:MAG TPA: YrdB family protein [Solirubrobacterales bacterium]|nr:YrdB family protein [Solirubrobacterales bacterium]